MVKFINYYFIISHLLYNLILSEPWSGSIVQDRNQFVFEDYYSLNKDSCIVADSISKNQPTVKYCNGSYEINSERLVIPRNTFPICGFFPEWYTLTAKFYFDYIKEGFKNGNSTYEALVSNCTSELSISSKSRFKEMYNYNTHELMCMRLAEISVATYGKDPEVVELTNQIENTIQENIRWKNSKMQSELFVSALCVSTNRQSCIASIRHLLKEKDSSILNLLGFNIKSTPTTFMYADGIDIIILQLLVEIMGMTLEFETVRGIIYYHISPKCPSEDFTELKPGLVGGFVEN